jgi:predicted MFS family arabinose efflux permease
MPALLALLVDAGRFTPPSAGHASAANAAAGVAAGVLGWFWIRRADRRLILVCALLLGFGADLSAVWVHSYDAIVLGRFATGFAGSTVMIVAMATMALAPHPARLFGAGAASQALFGAAFFLIQPRASFGLAGLFVLLAACWIAGLPCVFFVPGRVTAATSWSSRGPSGGLIRLSVVLPLLAFLCFYVASGAFWSFATLIGLWRGLSDETIGGILSLGLVLSIVGGVAAAAAGSRLGLFRPLVIALLANTALMAFLLVSDGGVSYFAASCGVNVAFTFVPALFLTLFGSIDRQGRLLSAASVVITAGLALGPWLLGSLTVGDDFTPLIEGAVAFYASSAALLTVDHVLRSKVKSRQGEPACPELAEKTGGVG